MKSTRYPHFLIASAMLFLACSLGQGRSPNILMIAIDDFNDWTASLGGHPQAQTPNIDRLAASGTLFTNAQCQAPVCGPSRASFFTGLNPSTSGIYLHVNDEDIKKSNQATARATYLTNYFEQHGYATMGAGKLLHQGAGDDLLQEYGGHKSFGPYAPDPINYSAEHTSTDWGAYPAEDEAMPDFEVANYGIAQLEQSHDKPFFLALGFNRPHVPWYVPQQWFDLFEVDKLATPPFKQDDLNDVPSISRRIHTMPPTPETTWLIEQGKWKEVVEAYLACVAFVDHQIGRVLEALEESRYADNTLIVLWSDHGYHLGEKNIVAKMTLWEESGRVPLIFAGPGISRGERCHRPVNLVDVYPTLLDLTGLAPNSQNDGHSLRPLLENPTAAWEFPALNFWGRHNTAVRTKRYRYILYEDGSEELYDHLNDPNEWNNLAQAPSTAVIRNRLRRMIPQPQATMSSVNYLTWNSYWTEITRKHLQMNSNSR